MRKEVAKSPSLSDKTAWIGVGLGLLFWFVESVIHAYIFHEGTLIQQIFRPAIHELWMRGLVTLMFIIFGGYAQAIINSRKRTNETLRESEEKLAGIVASVTDQMIMVDDQFNIVWANDVAKDLTGSDMAGKKCHVVYHGRDALCESCIVKKVFEDGRVHEFETQIMGAEGKQHIFWGTASVAARHEDGRPRMVVEFLRDITERKQAENELRMLNQQIEFILGAAKTGLDIIDSEFNVRYIDPEWGKVYGDPAGKKCYEYFMGLGEMCPGCGIPKALETKAITVTEEALVKEGNRPIQVTTIPFQDETGEWLVAEVNVDITERKKAEKELRKYQDQLEQMVEERTTELTATNEDLQQEIAERTQTEEELLRIKINLEEANQQLKQNQAQLVQSEKMASIGQLAAGVAHEINNPVGFINSNLTTLDEYRGDLTELIAAYLKLEELVANNPALSNDKDLMDTLEASRNLKERIDLDFILGDFDKIIAESREGTERIKKIVQDLKDFSHVDQAELNWADLNKGMESTLNIVWNELKYKAKVIKEYGDIPEVYCYPQQVNQVFMNILVNAAHAIEDNGEIKISTAHLAGAEPMVEVRISDTGKGIPPENLTKIFNPFFTTKPVGKGTGLGLSMVYSIVKKHDGEIKVESEVGKGTTFIVTLPVNGPKEKAAV
ncbi:MAG: ATP-binding protein [Thermodesulfobacteriota bacterium]